MPIIPPGWAQLNNILSLTGDSEEMICTMGIRFDDPPPTNMLAIVNAAWQAFAGNFDDVVCSVYLFKRTDMYVGQVGGSVVYSSTVAAASGNPTSQPVPQNCAYLLKKITGTAGRTGRGRMFVPGIPESFVNQAGLLETGVAAQVNAAAQAYIDGLLNIDGVASAALLHSLVGELPYDITNLVTDARIATQRRRLR